MNETTEKAGCAELTVVLLVLFPLHVAWSAYVGMQLWGWLCVPVLGWPALRYGHALILSALVSWAKPVPRPSDGDGKRGALVVRSVTLLWVDGLMLLAGYIGHRLVPA